MPKSGFEFVVVCLQSSVINTVLYPVVKARLQERNHYLSTLEGGETCPSVWSREVGEVPKASEERSHRKRREGTVWRREHPQSLMLQRDQRVWGP